MPPDTEKRAALGRRIQSVRKAKGMSLQELAKKSGISVGYLSEVERGLSAITWEKLARIAKALEVSAQFLTDGREEAVVVVAGEVRIPWALSSAAEQLGLSHQVTILLLQGKESLHARRSDDSEAEWGVNDWIEFYNDIKEYLP